MSKYEIRRASAICCNRHWWQVVDVPCNQIMLRSEHYFDRARRNRESLAFSKAHKVPIREK